MDQKSSTPPPHVVIFPLPLQGPIKCMLKLAELLCLAGGLQVTFLNTDYNHCRLLRHSDILSRFASYPQFRFETISDGLPDDHPRSGDRVVELFDSLRIVGKLLFKEMLTSGSLGSGTPVTCVIAEGVLDFAVEAAEELRIPFIFFETLSACALWTCFCVPRLIDVGELPFSGNDLDAPIKGVPGMEGFLRRRDLPSFCRPGDLSDPELKFAMTEGQRLPKSHGIILNTFEELDGPILSHMRALVPNLYPVGPIHAHLKMRLAAEPTPPPASSCSIWEEDRSCITWLDAQPLKSVIFVSLGSIATMRSDQLLEFWHGLVNSGQRFLWVRRPNSISGKDWEGQIPAELLEATEERGCLVSWAPQEEVLAHPAVGGFLTHSGWNSTLESIAEGMPMLCWPCFVDQQVNSRFVGEVWKLGIDMKDTCDRVVIERMIKDLMEVRSDEFKQSADRMAKLARESISADGSSSCNLKRLVEDIRLLKI